MHILRWSWWRRWHQAWARYYHYRQRTGHVPVVHKQGELTQPPAPIDVLWRRLESLLPPTPQTGRPFVHDRRLVLEAIVYVMQSHGAWRALPERFPPWQTVYAQFQRWRTAGIWEAIWVELEQPHSPG
jgi:hypothetical protein